MSDTQYGRSVKSVENGGALTGDFSPRLATRGRITRLATRRRARATKAAVLHSKCSGQRDRNEMSDEQADRTAHGKPVDFISKRLFTMIGHRTPPREEPAQDQPFSYRPYWCTCNLPANTIPIEIDLRTLKYWDVIDRAGKNKMPMARPMAMPCEKKNW